MYRDLGISSLSFPDLVLRYDLSFLVISNPKYVPERLVPFMAIGVQYAQHRFIDSVHVSADALDSTSGPDLNLSSFSSFSAYLQRISCNQSALARTLICRRKCSTVVAVLNIIESNNLNIVHDNILRYSNLYVCVKRICSTPVSMLGY